MGKASRTKVESTRREKIAAQRAAERRSEQRRRILLASGSVVVVLAVVLVFVIVKLNGGKPSASSSQGLSNGPTGSALTAVVNKVTSVPVSALEAVGDGSGAVAAKPSAGSGSALTANGKPEVLFIGAEYCPYCAAERWAMIVALSRFGTFKGLATTHSAVQNGQGNAEPDPDTPTFTFRNATYSSPYLTFTSVEVNTNIPDPSTGGYTNLQTPTKAQVAIWTKYSSDEGVPFVDFNNKYVILGPSYDPGVLDKLSWATIANDLSNPNSSVAKAVLGTANYITAAICKGMTGNQPVTACIPAVQALESQV